MLYYTILYYTIHKDTMQCNTIHDDGCIVVKWPNLIFSTLSPSVSLSLSLTLAFSSFSPSLLFDNLFFFSLSVLAIIIFCFTRIHFYSNAYEIESLEKSTYIIFYSNKLFRYSSRHNFTFTMNVLRRTYVLWDHIFFCNVSPGIFLISYQHHVLFY